MILLQKKTTINNKIISDLIFSSKAYASYGCVCLKINTVVR